MRATPAPSSGRHGSTLNVVGSGTRDHVGLLDRVEAGDRGAVEAHAALEGVVELLVGDGERLQLPEDVGEPQAHEADAVLRDERLDVFRGLGSVRHGGVQANGPRGRDGWTVRSESVQPAVRPGLELGHRGRELAALLGQLVGDLGRRAVAARGARRSRAPRAPSCARTAGGRERSGDRVGDLREAHPPAVQQHVEDRAGPALAHELDGLVVARAAPARRACRGSRVSCPWLSVHHAARSTRVSSTEPSTGTSPATLTIAVKDSMRQHRDRFQQLLVASSRPRAPPRAGAAGSSRGRRAAGAGSAAARPRAASPESQRLARATSSMPEAGLPARARVQLQPRLGAVVLGHREPDPLGAVPRQCAVPQLGSEAHVRLQRRGRAGQHAEEVRELPGRRRRTLEDRQRLLGRRQVVVDGEPTHLCLGHCHHRGGAGGAYER